MVELAADSDLPYATACRIVQTLLHEGLIEREPSRPRYRPTALVQSLSRGFQSEDALVAAARGSIVALTETFLWPVAVTTRVGLQMVVRDCTDALTPMTFDNDHPGCTLPIFGSAAGRAHLAFCDDDERQRLMLTARGTAQYGDDDAIALLESGALLQDIRRRGYATKLRNRYKDPSGKTSSLAAPILDRGKLSGVLIVSHFTSAVKMSEAEATLAEPLMDAARRIGLALPPPANDRDDPNPAYPPRRLKA
jgi:IclR family mhp operon transcriptional activator